MFFYSSFIYLITFPILMNLSSLLYFCFILFYFILFNLFLLHYFLFCSALFVWKKHLIFNTLILGKPKTKVSYCEYMEFYDYGDLWVWYEYSKQFKNPYKTPILFPYLHFHFHYLANVLSFRNRKQKEYWNFDICNSYCLVLILVCGACTFTYIFIRN